MHASTESRFSCDVCGKDFKQDFYLKRHLKSHNSIGKCVQCSICSTDIDKEKLKKHVKEVHQNRKEHKCSSCNMGFHRFSEMREHLSANINIINTNKQLSDINPRIIKLANENSQCQLPQ